MVKLIGDRDRLKLKHSTSLKEYNSILIKANCDIIDETFSFIG